MVDGSGVTVLQAGLQSWHTSIQLKPVQSFFQMPRVNFGKICENNFAFEGFKKSERYRIRIDFIIIDRKSILILLRGRLRRLTYV